MIQFDSDKVNKARDLAKYLRSEIIGQDRAIDTIVPFLQAGELGLAAGGRPLASFLFLGPTGVGKTELASQFTNHLRGDDRLLRLDMSEYQHPDSIERMLGGPTYSSVFSGKISTSEGGTVIFDEIEKAHPRLLDLLLQILDCGRLTLADGTIVDFTSHYIVLTSNIASLAIARSEQSGTALRRFVETQAQRYLRPELVARLDEVIVFNRLAQEHLNAIKEKFVRSELARYSAIGIELDPKIPAPAVAEFGGARSIRGVVAGEIRKLALDQILKTTSFTV